VFKLLGFESFIEFARNYALNTPSVLSVEDVIVTVSVTIHIMSTYKASNFGIFVKST
jgi:hypothetical protein